MSDGRRIASFGNHVSYPVLRRRGAAAWIGSRRATVLRLLLLSAAAAALSSSCVGFAALGAPCTASAEVRATDADDLALPRRLDTPATQQVLKLATAAPTHDSRRSPVLGAALGMFGFLGGLVVPSRGARADGLEDLIGEVEVTAPVADALANRKRVTGKAHDQAVDAAEVLHGLQKEWPQIQASGGQEGAKKILDATGGTTTVNFEIQVPAGANPGADVDACRVSRVSRPELGWRLGDTVSKINDMDVADQDELIEATKSLRDKGQPLKFGVQRYVTSPFITLEGALQKIYGDADAALPLPEPSDVQKLFRDLNFETGLAQDGITELSEVRKKLDAFVEFVDMYVDA